MSTTETQFAVRKAVIAGTLCTLTLIGVLSYSPAALAIDGGQQFTSRQERIGVFKIDSYDGSTKLGGCSATVLYSSVLTNRSWLVTAGHCFSYRNSLYHVYAHSTRPRARVYYLPAPGAAEDSTEPEISRVHVHPNWLEEGGLESWFGPQDMAFIRVNTAIPIFDAGGARVREFRRPIYTGHPALVSDPYSSKPMENFARNAFCGRGGDGRLRCDTLSNLWYSPNFRHQFLQLPAAAWETTSSSWPWRYQGGDSGGPLLKYAPGLNRQWEGAGELIDVAMYGAVLGVLQGPTMLCFLPNNANCKEADGLAAHFAGVEKWLDGTLTGHPVLYWEEIPRIQLWTFANLFHSSMGEPTRLTSISTQGYTFPAYTGKIVGIGIDKSTNRLHTWYDNGHMTIGTGADLDEHSQVVVPPPLSPDLFPRYTFAGASGKSHAQIVAMMISAAGQVHTWYADRTTVIGTPSDLDAVQTAQGYIVPPGKVPGDIVAIASRPGGGVLAYYRDGTFSEGVFDHLDAYAPPRRFEIGNSREAGEILGIDTFNNGTTLTVFEQRSLVD